MQALSERINVTIEKNGTLGKVDAFCRNCLAFWRNVKRNSPGSAEGNVQQKAHCGLARAVLGGKTE
jgi:hypothetical protein